MQGYQQGELLKRLVFFRPGEVSLVLRPNTQGGPLPPLKEGDLVTFFRSQLEMELHETPLLGPVGGTGQMGPRPLIPLQRTDLFAFQTVNLLNWVPDPLNPIYEGKLSDHVRDVGVAVGKINALPYGQRTVGDYTIVAATPNWLMLSNCGSGDSPAGRPSNPPWPPDPTGGIPHFRPDDVRAEVERSLQALDRVTVQRHPFQNRQGEGVKVAIFDAWPVPHGGDWLQSIRDRISAVATAGKVSTRLQKLVDDTTLPASSAGSIQFHDFVAGTPLEPMPSHHRNCGCGWEKSYPHADHGLFIADIIRDIAPKAELSIYRVLNDDGVGELNQIASAIDAAMTEAGDKPLVLNLSLKTGPELLMLKEFLTNSQGAYDDLDGWTHATCDGLNGGPIPLAERNALNDPSMQAAALVFKVAEARQKVFAVAAAGNDSCRTAPVARVVGPRFPAAIEGVLGVSAWSTNGNASYSNNSDIETGLPDDGIIAFGGEIVEQNGEDLSSSGLINLYVSDDLPNGGNEYGYAVWSGTSFAAAIVSGLAACVWSEEPQIPAIAVPASLSFPEANDLLTAIVRPQRLRARTLELIQR